MPTTAQILAGSLPKALIQDRIGGGNYARLCHLANKTGQYIILFGSRARGTAGPNSDWDYLLTGNSKARHRVFKSLPGYTEHVDGLSLTLQGHNIDAWQLWTRSSGNYGFLRSVVGQQDYHVFSPEEVKFPFPDKNKVQVLSDKFGLFNMTSLQSRRHRQNIHDAVKGGTVAKKEAMHVELVNSFNK